LGAVATLCSRINVLSAVHEWCNASVGFLTWVGPEILCRGVLGAGAVMAAVVLIWIAMRTLLGQNAE
jgi:hypothetical protein